MGTSVHTSMCKWITSRTGQSSTSHLKDKQSEKGLRKKLRSCRWSIADWILIKKFLVKISLFVYLPVCSPASLLVCLPVFQPAVCLLSTCLPVSAFLPAYPPACLPVLLPDHLPVCLSTGLPAWQAIYKLVHTSMMRYDGRDLCGSVIRGSLAKPDLEFNTLL